jgi:hypothetical protein
VVVAHCDAIAETDFHAASLPHEVGAAGVVAPNSVAIDLDIAPCANDADLTVMVDITRAHASARSEGYARAAVPARLHVLDGPACGGHRMDRPALGGICILFDDDVADKYIARVAGEGEDGCGDLDLAPRWIVREIDLSRCRIDIDDGLPRRCSGSAPA